MRKSIYNKNAQNKIPDKKKAGRWVEEIYDWLFTNSNNSSYDFFLLKEKELQLQLIEILNNVLPNETSVIVAGNFFDSIEEIYDKLEKDLEDILNFDPAANSKTEVIAAYPGFFAVVIYRLSHQLWQYDVPVIPRLISEYSHSKTGIDIHPGAEIGERFIIDHGTGVVIGETTVIGNNVKIYQGVTLGALSVNKDKAEKKRHPTIGDNVVIYANATILGGNTCIGNDAVIGGNVWITGSVPPRSLVYHKSEIIIKNKAPFPEPINFVI